MNGSRPKAGMTSGGVKAEEAGIASYSDVIPDLVGDPPRPVRSGVPDEIHSASMDPLKAERTNVVPTHVLAKDNHFKPSDRHGTPPAWTDPGLKPG